MYRKRPPAPKPGTPANEVFGVRCPDCDSGNYEVCRGAPTRFRSHYQRCKCIDCGCIFNTMRRAYKVDDFVKVDRHLVLKSDIFGYK